MAAIQPVFAKKALRRCACGGTAGPTGECEKCRKKRLSAERKAVTLGRGEKIGFGVPPIVHEVLNSADQPLDRETRAFMEPRFGYDFSKVRIHTDARAAESARALNATAYTVGHDIVFDTGRYAPDSSQGRKLLAHELVHVVQTEGAAYRGDLLFSQPGDPQEHEADGIANRVIKSGDPSTDKTMMHSAGIKSQVNTRPPHATLARQAAAPTKRSTIQCINANLADAGIPWGIIAVLGSICGMIGALAGLATGPGAAAASPSGATLAAAACVSVVTGLSVGTWCDSQLSQGSFEEMDILSG